MNKAVRKVFRNFFEKVRPHGVSVGVPVPHQTALLEQPWVMEALPWFTSTASGHILYPWEYSATWFDLPHYAHKMSRDSLTEFADTWRWVVSQLRTREMAPADLRTLGVPVLFPTMPPASPSVRYNSREQVVRALRSGGFQLQKEPAFRPELAPIRHEVVFDGWRVELSPDILSIHVLSREKPIYIPYGIWRLPEEYWKKSLVPLTAAQGYRAAMFRLWFLIQVVFNPRYQVFSSSSQDIASVSATLFDYPADVSKILHAIQTHLRFLEPWAALHHLSTIEDLLTLSTEESEKVASALHQFTTQYDGMELDSLLYGNSLAMLAKITDEDGPVLLPKDDPEWWKNREIHRFKDVAYYRDLIR